MSETLQPQPANGSAGVSSFDTLSVTSGSIGTGAYGVWANERVQVLPVPVERTRRIAILGFGETVADCPWRDESWELWGMNGFWRAAKADYGVDAPPERYTLWFDMHQLDFTREYGKQAGFGDAQERWLEQEHPFPIYMPEAHPEFPSVRPYPIAEVIAAAGRDYFTSTVAYALALAASMPDVAEIGLWGVDLVHDTEYGDQRPCAEYHIRAAEDRGIKVTIHERSALLRQRGRYGYAPENELLTGMRASLEQNIAKLDAAIKANQAKAEQLQAQAHTDDGALQACRAMLDRLNIFERGGRV